MIKQQVLRCLNSRGPVHAHPCSRRLWVNVVGCAAALSAAAAVSVGAPASAEDVTVASAGVGVAAAVGAALTRGVYTPQQSPTSSNREGDIQQQEAVIKKGDAAAADAAQQRSSSNPGIPLPVHPTAPYIIELVLSCMLFAAAAAVAAASAL